MRQCTLILGFMLLLYASPCFPQTASLLGSPESQIRENRMMEEEGLSQIEDDADLDAHIARDSLVPLPEGLLVDGRVREKFRFVRPWAASFLSELNDEFVKQFNKPLKINSAVRTREYQVELRKRNWNAAPASGPKSSSHLSGATVDIGKKSLTEGQRLWLREWFLHLKSKGLIEATEEWNQTVFHIMISKKWEASRQARNAPPANKSS